MIHNRGPLVLYDYTFRDVDHLISIRTRRLHRKRFSSRSTPGNAACPPSILPSASPQLPEDSFHDLSQGFGDDWAMDDGFPGNEGPLDEGGYSDVEDESGSDSERESDWQDEYMDEE